MKQLSQERLVSTISNIQRQIFLGYEKREKQRSISAPTKKPERYKTVSLNILSRHRALIITTLQGCMVTAERFRVASYPREFPAEFCLQMTQAGRVLSEELRE